MTKKRYHAPADCPVCGDALITTRKGCTTCGTELAGEFANCEFCALDEADLALLKIFLASRGNMREVEKHLQVSYPTARARFDAVTAKLGLTPNGADAAPEAETGAAEPSGQESLEEQVLARVARGEISAEDAAKLLG